ncbi:MAG: helix-turn-helix domain-containing protein, partial [Rikenellaceae bacterium]
MKHLTVEQRYAIFAMLQKGYTQKEIAETIKVNKSTISRELRRNCDKRSGRYNSDLAHR